MLVFLFNVGGYYLVFWGLQIHNDKLVWSRLETGIYTEEETTLLKIPMALPYPVFSDEYQPLEEEFEHHGNFYKSIKQKLKGDTLYIVCIKDQNKKSLQSTMTKYAKDTNDLPTQEKKQSTNKLLNEYELHAPLQMIQKGGWCLANLYTPGCINIISQGTSILSPPPKV